eukprot:34079-Chlamydomonas_euryale.AAC.1
MQYIGTSDNVADFFTEHQPAVKFIWCREHAVTNVTRLRRQVQACKCPPQLWRHSVELCLSYHCPAVPLGGLTDLATRRGQDRVSARGGAILPAPQDSF